MFENMIKHEKAWRLFIDWFRDRYGLRIKIYESRESDFILCIMPFFFDEYNIDIEPSGNGTVIHFRDKLKNFTCQSFTGERKESFIKACEKAFKILEDQNG